MGRHAGAVDLNDLVFLGSTLTIVVSGGLLLLGERGLRRAAASSISVSGLTVEEAVSAKAHVLALRAGTAQPAVPPAPRPIPADADATSRQPDRQGITLPVVLGVLGVVGAIGSAYVARGDEPQDCTAYLAQLAALDEQYADRPVQLLGALGTLRADALREECGSPVQFIAELHRS